MLTCAGPFFGETKREISRTRARISALYKKKTRRKLTGACYTGYIIAHCLPTHRCVLQDWDWELLPEHPAPPPDEGGLVQVRMRVCDPPPQV